MHIVIYRFKVSLYIAFIALTPRAAIEKQFHLQLSSNKMQEKGEQMVIMWCS